MASLVVHEKAHKLYPTMMRSNPSKDSVFSALICRRPHSYAFQLSWARQSISWNEFLKSRLAKLTYRRIIKRVEHSFLLKYCSLSRGAAMIAHPAKLNVTDAGYVAQTIKNKSVLCHDFTRLRNHKRRNAMSRNQFSLFGVYGLLEPEAIVLMTTTTPATDCSRRAASA